MITYLNSYCLLTPFESAFQLFLYCKCTTIKNTLQEKTKARYETLPSWYETLLVKEDNTTFQLAKGYAQCSVHMCCVICYTYTLC